MCHPQDSPIQQAVGVTVQAQIKLVLTMNKVINIIEEWNSSQSVALVIKK